MKPSKVIRIDAEVWAELQRRARPLEDTPNSVLRRVFGLPDEGTGPERLEPRVARLLALVQDLVGQMPQVEAARKGYSFLSHTAEMSRLNGDTMEMRMQGLGLYAVVLANTPV